MMADIFSNFDFINFNMLNLHLMLWVSSTWSVYLICQPFWVTSSWNMVVFSFKALIQQQTNRTYSKNLTGLPTVLCTLFMYIGLVNLLGGLPYVFSISCHPMFTLLLSSMFWLSLMCLGFWLNYKKMISHFLPMGSPAILSPFLSIVELVSILVRPITLAIRLAANLAAGHVVLSLLGNYLSFHMFSSFYFIFFIMLETGYFLFEICVSLIQAYIFVLLLTLYSDDLGC